jgi:hypothetical protein
MWTSRTSPCSATLERPARLAGGDVNSGVKWEFHKESRGSRLPALGASLYIELPTGDAGRQLGSGLTDYWLNLIVQKSLSDKTRVDGNAGYLFAGNTSTGVLGIQATRGHAYTGGFSILHDFTARMTLAARFTADIQTTEIWVEVNSSACLAASTFSGLARLLISASLAASMSRVPVSASRSGSPWIFLMYCANRLVLGIHSPCFKQATGTIDVCCSKEGSWRANLKC